MEIKWITFHPGHIWNPELGISKSKLIRLGHAALMIFLTDSPLLGDNVCVYLDIFFSSMTGEIDCFVDMYSIFHLQNGIKAVFKRTYRCPWQFSFLCHLVLQLRLKALLSCLVFCAVVARPDFAVVGSGLKRPCTPACEHYPYSRDWPTTVFMRFWVAWEMLKCWIHFLISVL